MLEVAYIIVAIALIVFIVYLIITLQKVGRVIDETENTVKTLTSDVNVTLHHTNELLAKVNVLADDAFLLKTRACSFKSETETERSATAVKSGSMVATLILMSSARTLTLARSSFV